MALALLLPAASAAAPEVIIDPGGAPPEVLQIITDSVNAITRLAEDQDVREVSRLRRRAREAAMAALQTQGYFSGKVTLEVFADPDADNEFWDMSIVTGPRTHVRHIGLAFSGAITAERYAKRREKLLADWPLAQKVPFINDEWSRAKALWLDEISSQDFYFARYQKTRAAVYRESSQADLDLEVASGPPVRLGELQVLGLQRVPESLVRRYVRYEPGAAYDRRQMEDWQQALQATRFFRGAFVTLADEERFPVKPAAADEDDADSDEDAASGSHLLPSLRGRSEDRSGKTAVPPEGAPAVIVTGAGVDDDTLTSPAGPVQPDVAHPASAPADPDAAARRPDNTTAPVQPVDPDAPVTLPVRVRVSEAPARYFTGSLGVDSDHGVRVEGLFRQNIVFGWPVSIETGAGVDKDSQRFFFDVHLPPTDSGYYDSFGVLYEHSDLHGLENHRTGFGWKRSQDRKAAGDSRVEYEVRWAALVAYDKTRVSGAERYEVPSLSATWQWLRRDVNNKYDPREGNLFEFGLGAGTTLDDGRPFFRSSLRAQQWWPIGERDVLTLRGEVGHVWSDTDRLPQDFSWRTGGARTIRGYRYRSIGIPRGNAIVGAPALGVVSVQYTHYFTDMLGLNLFVDAGDAAPSFRQFRWHLGYGAGLAVNTPAGPFNVDLAWAQKDRRLRLQFSLGIAF